MGGKLIIVKEHGACRLAHGEYHHSAIFRATTCAADVATCWDLALLTCNAHHPAQCGLDLNHYCRQVGQDIQHLTHSA